MVKEPLLKTALIYNRPVRAPWHPITHGSNRERSIYVQNSSCFEILVRWAACSVVACDNQSHDVARSLVGEVARAGNWDRLGDQLSASRLRPDRPGRHRGVDRSFA